MIPLGRKNMRAATGSSGSRDPSVWLMSGAARPDTILGWYRKLIAKKFDGSRFRQRVGRPRIAEEIERLVVRMAKENPSISMCPAGLSPLRSVRRNFRMHLRISTCPRHRIHSWNPGASSTGFLSADRFMPPEPRFIAPSPHLITFLYRRSSPCLRSPRGDYETRLIPPRVEYYQGYYAADIFDPDGYSFEVVHKS